MSNTHQCLTTKRPVTKESGKTPSSSSKGSFLFLSEILNKHLSPDPEIKIGSLYDVDEMPDH